MVEAIKSVEAASVSKAVVIVYPDVRTTKDVNKSEASKRQAEFFPKLIARYKNKGFRIVGVVYQDTTPERFSPLYDFSQFDQVMPLDTTKEDLSPNESMVESDRVRALNLKVLDSMDLQPGASVIVGGFHASACVLAMAEAIKSQGHAISIDFLLTDMFSRLFYKHQDRRNGQTLDNLLPGDPYLWKWSTNITRNQLNESK